MARRIAPTLEASLDVAVDDWRQAVKAACRPLVRAGAVTENYPARCVDMVEQHGPYMVVAPGIALAHARPEDGVNRLGLTVVRLAEPVPFGHPENDPVDLVFAFGSPDKEQHLALLKALARGLRGDLAERLRSVEEEELAGEYLRALLDEPP